MIFKEFILSNDQTFIIFDVSMSMCILDFQKKRVTDLKSNRRLIIPEPSENIVNNTPIEVGFANIKTRVDNFVTVNMETKCDQKGYPRKSNLSANEMEGLKSLKHREDVFVTTSDKTKKLCVNTKENYVSRMRTHLVGNEEMNWEEKQGIEKILNAHAIQMVRMFKVSANYQYPGRVKTAMHNKFGHVPVLRGSDKDHKEGFDPGSARLSAPSWPLMRHRMVRSQSS